jgi:hypothetical protein
VSITRVGNLGRVFKEGESELFNGIARLAVLYEDLRLEVGELWNLRRKRDETGEVTDHYRASYFLRRALATLIEFRGGLTTIRRTQEFKQAESGLSTIDAESIVRADKYLQENWTLIKDLRNEFGGHVQLKGVEFATKHLSNVVGKVTWNQSTNVPTTLRLECDFAGDIVAGVISSKLEDGRDPATELRKAFTIIHEGFRHAQMAMTALVHAFLWNRFG